MPPTTQKIYTYIQQLLRQQGRLAQLFENAAQILPEQDQVFEGYREEIKSFQGDLLREVKKMGPDIEEQQSEATQTFLEVNSRVDPVFTLRQSDQLLKHLKEKINSLLDDMQRSDQYSLNLTRQAERLREMKAFLQQL